MDIIFIYIVPPKFITNPENRVVESSKKVTFKCSVVANPVAYIAWIINGKEVTKNLSIGDDTKVIIKNISKESCIMKECTLAKLCETSSILEIFDVDQADDGEYICEATNQGGSHNISAILSVHSMPTYVYIHYSSYFVY